jgi:hypothetical protein
VVTVRKVLLVGGPKDGESVDVTALDSLPPAIVLPYYPMADGVADKVWYRPVRVVMFGRVMWVLAWAGLAREQQDTAILRTLLKVEAFASWETSPEVPHRGH